MPLDYSTNPSSPGYKGRKRRPPPKRKIVSTKVTPLGAAARSSAETEADSIISELLAELGLSRDSSRREAERSAQQEMARAQALSSAMMALGIPKQIQGIYDNSAQSISALAGGFSQDTQALAAQQGAEQANMVSGTGQEGAVRNEGAAMGDVLYGAQGFIPARGLEQMGAAFASEAALQPGFTLQFGQMAAAKQMEDYIKNVLPGFTDKEALIRSKRPSLVQDAKERRKKETFDLYEAGLLTQRQLAKRLGLANWRKYPNVLPGSEQPKASASLSKELGYLVDERGNPILNSKGKPIPLPRDPAKLDRFGSASAGYWAIDPTTGQVVNLLPPQPKQYAPKGYQLKTLKDGSTAIFDPNTGQTSVVAPPPKGSNKPKLTTQQAAKFRGKARTLAEAFFNGGYETAKDGTQTWIRPLTLAEALEELQKTDIPWGLGKSIISSYYRKHFIGPVPKDKPARGGRKNTAYSPESLTPSLQGMFESALSQGFTNLGTYNSESKLPGGGVSDHAKWPAEAFDIGGFSGGYKNAKARRMFQWLIRQPGVKYVILGDKIWSPEKGLHAYTSGGHDTHIHVSGTGGGSV